MKQITVRPKDDLQPILDKAAPGTTIHFTPGVYRQKLMLTTPGLILEGEGADQCVLIWDDYAKKLDEQGREYVTFRTWTLAVCADNVEMRGLSVVNDALNPHEKGQEVALTVYGDHFQMRDCVLRFSSGRSRRISLSATMAFSRMHSGIPASCAHPFSTASSPVPWISSSAAARRSLRIVRSSMSRTEGIMASWRLRPIRRSKQGALCSAAAALQERRALRTKAFSSPDPGAITVYPAFLTVFTARTSGVRALIPGLTADATKPHVFLNPPPLPGVWAGATVRPEVFAAAAHL